MSDNKFFELYAQNKTRNFDLHLVRAYLPVSKITKLWDTLKDPNKMVCCCCKHPLAAIDEIYEKTIADQDVMEKQFKWFMDRMLNPEAHKDDTRMDSPSIQAIEGKIQAFTGENTETVMCLDCLQKLVAFTQDKLMREDKQITFAIRREMVKDFPEISHTLTMKQNRKSRPDSKPVTPATNTMADFMSPATKKALGLTK